MIKEKIQALDNTHKQYKQANRPFKTKEINAYHFQNYAEIFFSSKELENINLVKLISAGDYFGKVKFRKKKILTPIPYFFQKANHILEISSSILNEFQPFASKDLKQ